jgi:hypothetical protein
MLRRITGLGEKHHLKVLRITSGVWHGAGPACPETACAVGNPFFSCPLAGYALVGWLDHHHPPRSLANRASRSELSAASRTEATGFGRRS